MGNSFRLLLIAKLFLGLSQSFAQTPEETPLATPEEPAKSAPVLSSEVPEKKESAPVTESVSPGAADEGEYEIDYEEEPDSEDEAPEKVVPKRASKVMSSSNGSGGPGPAVQGSRALHRFTPILKSETKSVYRKEGKVLDVDTD